MTWKVINGNSAEILKTYPDNSFDCVVTDPPYGINFLGKAWDSNTGDKEVYEQCLRVLKPGGHLLAFSAARTYHHLAMTVELCGFEIRDQIMWIYGSGFPKSQDVGRQIDKSQNKGKFIGTGATQISGGPKEFPDGALPRSEKMIHEPETDEAKQWSGWGTQLKPAHEPIVMARKPMKQPIKDNVQEYGTGAINIDATRVGDDIMPIGAHEQTKNLFDPNKKSAYSEKTNIGRFPANVILDREAGKILDEQAPKVGNLFSGKRTKSSTTGSGHSLVKEKHKGEDNGVFDGLGGASRFFYCPKVNRKERHIGCDMENAPRPGSNGHGGGVYENDTWSDSLQNVNITSNEHNTHPTVKPIELMKYLIKLVTPPNGHILDPFNGSGSTGCAAVELGFDYTGIELDPNYVEIANKRISHWESECKPKTTYNNLFEEK
jgi:DNA modification methylase